METIKKRKKCKSGFIFMCSERTQEECYINRVFGLPRSQLEMVARIETGTVLFLFDLDRKLLFGPYAASCNGGADLVPEAFGGRFPSQVKFEITEDCLPLPESVFKDALLDNYTTKFKFKPELSCDQVEKLLSLFRPIGLLDQLPSQAIHNPPHEPSTLLATANSDGTPVVAKDEMVVPASNPLVGSSADTSSLLQMSGFIFMCSKKTKGECFVNCVFGMPRKQLELVEKINPGTRLFLFDFDEKLLYGIFNAITWGGANLVPGAFAGNFPAQVKFEILQDCAPLSESIFKEAIHENYTTKFKFKPELSSRQVVKLLSLFLPAGLPGKSHEQIPQNGLHIPPATSGPAYMSVPAHLPPTKECFGSSYYPSSSDQHRQQHPTYPTPPAAAGNPCGQHCARPPSDQYKLGNLPPQSYQYGQDCAFPPSYQYEQDCAFPPSCQSVQDWAFPSASYDHQQYYAPPPSDKCRQDYAPLPPYQSGQDYVPPPLDRSKESYMLPSSNQYRQDYAPSDQYGACKYNLVSNEPQYASMGIATNANYPYPSSYLAPTVYAANAFSVHSTAQLSLDYPATSSSHPPFQVNSADYPVASTGPPLQVNPLYCPATLSGPLLQVDSSSQPVESSSLPLKVNSR